jgi:glucose 1-dehydrogenase
MGVDLSGQIALVTGASSGLGLGIAHELARAGAAVGINYHSHAEPAERAAAEIIAAGGRARAIEADASQEGEVLQMFDAVIREWGALDILVANSGIQQDAPIGEMTLQQWDRVIALNLTGEFLCAREAIRRFRAQGRRGVSKACGKILCMSSVHEVIPWAGHANYAAAKGGVGMLMRTLAQEVAADGIRVNGIAPGAIRTNINRAQTEGEAAEQLLKLIPYNRIGEVADVARAAAWLVSDEADYVVGTTLFVDGGMTLYPGFRDNG